MTTIAIVTPWFDHPELRSDYMAAIADENPYDVIIVDNGSTPPIEDAAIRFEENRGFSAACNAGLARSTADAILFLNNDIALTDPGWLDRIRAALEPGVLVGACIRDDHHGDVDGQSFPYLDGWCLAGMRADLLEIGGFDEGFEEPAYYSDNDLCLRARAAGMTLREARVGLLHKIGQTSRVVSEALQIANYERYAGRVRETMGTAA